MMPENDAWEQIRTLFDATRRLAVEQRAAFLSKAGADAGLRGEVEGLLRAHEALEAGVGGGFLESLEPSRAAALLASHVETDDAEDPEGLPAGEMVGRYRIVRRAGRGGMGVVYLAHDPRLNRPVALKLLPPHLSLDPSARRRFEEEARAASLLDHPHIATIYEIGEAADGRVFIAMAYCEGETLRQRLERGPLPVPAAVSLAARIAEGLACAHARGIVHRDVKPGNVILTPDGGVRLVDFGVARIAGSVLTGTGAGLGTVAYMSPEQTRGEPAQPGTDVWSLGVTLYEMLAGRRPFPADDEQALVYAVRNDEPEPIRRLRPEVPRALAEVVERCLRKDPSDRYRDGGALLSALRTPRAHSRIAGSWWRTVVRYGTAAGLLLLLAVLTFSLRAWMQEGDAELERLSRADVGTRIAVLPLAAVGAGPEEAYFAEGLTEELISRLSLLPGLRVIARASVMPYRGSEGNIAEIGRELNVGFVLDGRVGKVGSHLDIAVQLIDVETGDRQWGGEYGAELTDLSDVLRGIAAAVADALDVPVRAGERRQVTEEGTDSPDAYTSYLKGRYFLGRLDEESFRRSRDHFQLALDRDPTFAHAWSGLSHAYAHLASLSGLHAGEAYPRARAAAERALELDPDLADAHASLAVALSMYYWDQEAAERHFRRAIELDPSFARARRTYATHLRNMGRFDEALSEVRTAQELDPLSAFPRFEEAIILYVARRYEAAIAQCRRLLATDPGSTHAYLLLTLAYAQQERYDEGLAAVELGDPGSKQPDAHAIRGYIYARTGRREEALRMLRDLDRLAAEQPVSAFHRVAIHVGLGEHDRAMDLLEEAAEERTGQIRLLKVEPLFDPLRAQPRFRALLEKVGLAG